MNLEQILRLLTILQIITLSQNSHVQEAKKHIRAEVRSAIGQLPPSYHHQHNSHHHHHHHNHHQQHHHNQQQRYYHQQKYHGAHWHNGQRVYRWHNHHNRWSGRRSKSMERHHFTAWSAWSTCNSECIKSRERYCKVKRKCGYTKHLEEHKCWGCHPAPVWHATNAHDASAPQAIHHTSSNSPAIIINAPQSGPPLPPQVLPTQAPPIQQTVDEKIRLPVLQEIGWQITSPSHEQHAAPHKLYDDNESEAAAEESSDYYVINEKPRQHYKKKRRPIYIDVEDYEDLEAEENEDELNDSSDDIVDDDDDRDARGQLQAAAMLPKKYAGHVRSIRKQKQHRRGRQQRQQNPRHVAPSSKVTQRNLPAGDDGIEGDIFQYEDFDFDNDRSTNDDEYGGGDSYDDNDYADDRNSSLFAAAAAAVSSQRERATPDGLIPKHRRIYSKWSRWTKCSPKCTTRRYKKCRVREQCGREVLREIAYCYTEGSFCQQWLQAQVAKSPPYELRPMAASRRRDISSSFDGSQSNSIVGNDYIMNGKGYRGAEYTPLKLRCGIAPIRSNKRNMYNMLKIIGGKAARKGEWPWQVAIFNRFKEAFCGGTLIAPQWVLTAAHCVRKVLYVRLGEHNLDYEDGTELQLRVMKSFKHPNFDKKTVDSDVALLRLPKSVNTTTWIGFSCLPHPYQPLPKNMDCTVIGWGKRRNRDVAGTSVLHQAEVPMIPMDNCRMVYHDYTITKNMFCAGHKRGRIDTCAGDSGGPLLCRDTTKPNHPWTIFGITSFGDGCAKRNKFGIYAKVPNYVDWVWSVINCNGNCKLHQRNYGN